jgi:thioredoxin reductase (NADPH)
MTETYDVIIIGCGPGGLSAGVYAGRYKLKTLIIGKEMGGLAATAHKVCNYPSYIEINGMELMQRFIKHVEELGVPIVYAEVTKIEKKQNLFVITADKEYKAKKIVFAGGTTRQKLGVLGEGKFHGKGVSYCATCDAAFFKNKIVSVIGGSDAALTAALLLSEFATKVFIIYRKKKFFRGDPTWVGLINKEKKIQTIFNEEIAEIIGNKKVEKIKLKSGKTMKMDGIFIEIGSVPEVNYISQLKVKITDKGYIITDKNQQTNIPGFYAAGDITESNLKQIVTAASQGAVAAYNIYKEVKQEKVG